MTKPLYISEHVAISQADDGKINYAWSSADDAMHDIYQYVNQQEDTINSQAAIIKELKETLWLAHQTLEEFIGYDHNGNASDAMAKIRNVVDCG